MKKNKILSIRTNTYLHLILLSVTVLMSCADFEQDFADERFHTVSHAQAVTAAGGTQGIKALDAGILSYFRDGETSDDEFGIKAVDLGMDLRSNDMDMSRNTWFGAYNNYDNRILTSNDNEYIWEFFYKIINRANLIINSVPDNPTEEQIIFKAKSHTYRAIAYFYLIRIYQHTRAADATEAIPIDPGNFEPQPKSTVAQVKQLILDDLNTAYEGLKDYGRASKEEVDGSVVAAYLARYHLTYENWVDAEKFADIAMRAGTISADIMHGFDEISLSEVIWGASVTDSTSEIYGSFFSHTSQINDGYSGWNHFKTVNSNLYDMIPATDTRLAWFADQQYAPGTVMVPGTWGHYNITPKYTSLKFIAQPGPGQFIGDYIYLRNTEFYLTKAEALARQGRDMDAQQVLFDLNSVRDPGYAKSTNTGQALIDEILLYRRIELWGDGVAFFDMARNGVGLNRKDGRTNLVMPGADLVIPALDDQLIYSIPQQEIDANPNF
ncbi:RagB/SusD family nutrient uptake outer membrane protein [Tenacibaculum agarivorans]|uniref:RagB/SusD family nutrient uptake outer membrane protein n=1 Tax=Tenacibaculum agarivorans TaxID=1908389 RepID=UPI00094B8BF5|nr:RagB/SusD family nutrient uptake outer membrane protein [Tenacibaculum agarivorans]